MKTAARVQAAIEILASLADDRGPADRILSGYFRQRRYAGSKDRRWVGDFVYAVLRNRARHDWRGANGDAVKLVVSQLHQQGENTTEIAAYFNGEKFAPAELDGENGAYLAALDQEPGAPPDWVTDNYPQWLSGELKQAFGDAMARQMQAFNQRAPVDLRINSLRPASQSIGESLRADGTDVEKGRYAPNCLRLPAGRYREQQLHRAGHVEIQDESSQIAALLSHAKPGQQVVDFCAGAGGKSLAMAAMMENRGQIYALDVETRRLEELKRRAKRADARNIQPQAISTRDGDPWLAAHGGEMNLVFVDAPCSGLGTWRRNPDAPWRLTPAALQSYKVKQAEILRRAAALVAPGGLLLYAVCSMLPGEGSEQVSKFLADFSDFQPSEALPGDIIELTQGEILLTPGDHGCDGFYLARLKRA